MARGEVGGRWKKHRKEETDWLVVRRWPVACESVVLLYSWERSGRCSFGLDWRVPAATWLRRRRYHLPLLRFPLRPHPPSPSFLYSYGLISLWVREYAVALIRYMWYICFWTRYHRFLFFFPPSESTDSNYSAKCTQIKKTARVPLVVLLKNSQCERVHWES